MVILWCALQTSDIGESTECISYNDWIIIDNSKQNFVAKPFHVNEVGISSGQPSTDDAWH